MRILKTISPDHFHKSQMEPLASLPKIAGRVEQLIAWSEEQTDAEVEIVSSEFEFLGVTYPHYLVTLDFLDGRTYAGHGRSIDAHLALLKAFSEALERWAMATYFRRGFDPADVIQTEWRKGDHFSATQFPTRFLPTPRMHNSNGWAVDSTIKQAAKRSLREAIERHTLQLQYWMAGLAFLKVAKTVDFMDYTIECAPVKTGIGDLTALVASFRRQDLPGKLFGHSTVDKVDSDSWLHPMIEGFQIAEAARYTPPNGAPEDIFDEIQRSFFFDDIFYKGAASAEVKAHDSLNLSFVVVDLAETLSLSFPLYATWAFSDRLLPIYLEKNLLEEDQNLFSDQFREITGFSKKLFQTPFI